MWTATLISRLDARDRALFIRWSVFERASRRVRLFWAALTHLGGATFSVAASTLPIILRGNVGLAAQRSLATLVLSHLVVQLIKRVVGRPRPSHTVSCCALVNEPDRFSFPSGHSAAAMSVAFMYALVFPTFAPLLIPASVFVGMSRVCLGVHYPGDVLMGQLIAIGTGFVVAAV